MECCTAGSDLFLGESLASRGLGAALGACDGLGGSGTLHRGVAEGSSQPGKTGALQGETFPVMT